MYYMENLIEINEQQSICIVKIIQTDSLFTMNGLHICTEGYANLDLS